MTLAAETPFRRHHRQSSHWSFEDRVQRLPSGCVSGKKIVDNHPIARCRNTRNYYVYVFMCSPAIITIPTKHTIRKNINGERRIGPDSESEPHSILFVIWQTKININFENC